VFGLIVVSFFIHCRGATSWDTHVWNEEPVGVDDNPTRVWDWRDIQFLRGITMTSPLACTTEHRPAWDQQRLVEDCATSLGGSLGCPRQVKSKSPYPQPRSTTGGSMALGHAHSFPVCCEPAARRTVVRQRSRRPDTPGKSSPCVGGRNLHSRSHRQPRPLQSDGRPENAQTDWGCR